MPPSFLATCPKSNSATIAMAKAKQAIKESPVQSVPHPYRIVMAEIKIIVISKTSLTYTVTILRKIFPGNNTSKNHSIFIIQKILEPNLPLLND